MGWTCLWCGGRLSVAKEDEFQAVLYCPKCSKWFTHSKHYRTLSPINGKQAYKIMRSMKG